MHIMHQDLEHKHFREKICRKINFTRAFEIFVSELSDDSAEFPVLICLCTTVSLSNHQLFVNLHRSYGRKVLFSYSGFSLLFICQLSWLLNDSAWWKVLHISLTDMLKFLFINVIEVNLLNCSCSIAAMFE